MSLHRTPRPSLWARQARPILRCTTTTSRAALGLVLLAACGGSTPSGPPGGGGGGGTVTATLSGTVRESESSGTLADATVTIGNRTANTDASGRFTLSDLPIGAATVKVERTGYQATEEALTFTAGANSHDFLLSPKEIYVLGSIAVYVPAGVGPLRGTIIALGGPYTDGLVTGGRIEPAQPAVDAEAKLQALGAALRVLARTKRMALLGSASELTNVAGSDDILFSGLGTAAQMSGHTELTNAPVVLLGLSTGSPEASGLASRHTGRAAGLIVWLPPSVPDLTDPAALAIPAFVIQAEDDNFVYNPPIQATIWANRSRGGLWGLAVEPGVGHAPTLTGNGAVTSWIGNVIDLRLPATAGAPLVALDQTSGWLGNRTTFEIAAWADYQGDRTIANWLLSNVQANSWKNLMGAPVGAVRAPRQ